MKNAFVYLFIIISMISLALPAYAGHDHGGGSHESMGHSSSQSQIKEQATMASDKILKECFQHLDSIQRHIGRLQGQLVEGKAATSSINDELERLEQHLREAKDITKSLRVF